MTSNKRGGRRTPPYAFTEQGVAMLSSVLKSKQFAVVFDAIRAMMNPPQGEKQPIGFVHPEKESDV